jgi:hypothetical protein
MTNITPEMMTTHCGWGDIPAIVFLPHLTLLVSLYLLTHGLIKRRKAGSAKPFGEVLWVSTTAFLALFLTLGLWRLGLLLSQGVVRVWSRDDISDLGPNITSEFLMNCAYMIPPVALGFIGSFVLRNTKRVDNCSANNPVHTTGKPASDR